MALRNLLEGASKIGLPDLGVSESLFGVTTQQGPQTFQVGEGLDPQQAQAAQAAVRTPIGPRLPTGAFRSPGGSVAGVRDDRGLQAGGQSSVGATGAPSGAASAAGVTNIGQPGTGLDFNALTTQAENEAQRRFEESQAGQQRTARDIFSPIISNLDEQLGALPTQQGLLEEGVGLSAQRSSDFVEGEKARQLAGLGRSEEAVRQQSKKTLRELGQDVNRLLQASGRFLGAIGAGDSSATGQAAKAIGRKALRQRGLALETLQGQISDIESKRADVEQIASNQLIDIQRAKEEQLNSIAADFQRIQQELNAAKAGATSDERRFLAEQEQSARAELNNRLNQLNDEVRQAQQATDVWLRDRSAQLEDFGRRLASRAAFDTQSALGQLQQFNKLRDAYMSAGLPFDQASNRAQQDLQTNIDVGLLEQPAPDEKDELETENLRLKNQQLQGELNLGQSLLDEGTNQGLFPDTIPLLGRL